MKVFFWMRGEGNGGWVGCGGVRLELLGKGTLEVECRGTLRRYEYGVGT